MTGGPDPEVGPAYAGAADHGVVSSVGPDDPAAGEVVEAVDSEHRKIDRVLAEMLLLADAGDTGALRLRWGGVVREILEHEAAERRVVLPAAEGVADGDATTALADLRRDQEALLERLARHDELNTDVSPDEVRSAVRDIRGYLGRVDELVRPLLERLPEEQRAQLGEDLRQVKG
jgi:hypothetical protein